MNNTNEDWQKVETTAAWDFEKNSEVEGTYVLREEEVGRNASNLYHLELEDGKRVSIWGNTILDNRFELVDLGEEVKIVYLGMEKSEKTGRSYRNFDLYHRKAAFKKVEDTSTTTAKAQPSQPTAKENVIENEEPPLPVEEEKVDDKDLPF